MSAAARGSTGSGPGWVPVPGDPSSVAAAPRAAGGSRRRGLRVTSLRGRSEFRRVRRNGSRRHVGGVTVFSAAGVPGVARVSVVAGRRVGGAVERNRAKRRLRAAVARVPMAEGRDCLVLATREVLGASFEDLVDWVRKAVV